jgi:hypothetical protein
MFHYFFMIYREIPFSLLLSHLLLGTISSGPDTDPKSLVDYHYIRPVLTWFLELWLKTQAGNLDIERL